LLLVAGLKVSSSIGRAPVSKTGGWGFDSLLACTERWWLVAGCGWLGLDAGCWCWCWCLGLGLGLEHALSPVYHSRLSGNRWRYRLGD
jgi:hypothetical protein